MLRLMACQWGEIVAPGIAGRPPPGTAPADTARQVDTRLSVTATMALPALLQGWRISAFGAPLVLGQNPDLVIAQCRAGIPGCAPALPGRAAAGQPSWLYAWLR